MPDDPSPPPLPLDQLAIYRHDPAALVARLWPHLSLPPYQREILESVRVNSHTFVHSGHKMGKSLVAAVATLWFFLTRSPATVLLISAKEKQLEHVMWAEIATLLQLSTEPLPIVQNRLRLRAKDADDEIIARHEVVGCAASEPESLQGHNLARLNDGEPTVLVVCEEASAIPDRFIEALLPQSHRLLAIGNPLRVEGWFYKGCKDRNQGRPHEAGLLRWVRHVSPEESPNLIRSREMDQRGEKGPYPMVVPGLLSRQEYDEWDATWDEPRKRVRLRGELPDEEAMKLYPPSWLDLAQRLGVKLREQLRRDERWHGDGPYALGIDVAYGGGDLTAWVVLGRYGVRHVHARSTPNTTAISGYTIELIRRYQIRSWAVAFDSGGGGKQIADMLRERRDMDFGEIVDVSFGANPLDQHKYYNRRTELYGELRTVLEATAERQALLALSADAWPRQTRCLSLPPDDAKLREDLAVLPYEWDNEGKLRLPPKDHRRRDLSSQMERSVRDMLSGRSPDRGDALALAWFAWTRGKEYLQLERVERPMVYS
jgi:hypothetical protein